MAKNPPLIFFNGGISQAARGSNVANPSKKKTLDAFATLTPEMTSGCLTKWGVQQTPPPPPIYLMHKPLPVAQYKKKFML